MKYSKYSSSFFVRLHKNITSSRILLCAAPALKTHTPTLFTVGEYSYAQDLERSAEPVLPFRFLLQLRDRYPQFAQQSNTGQYMQQDAEECWTQLLYALRESLQARVPAHPRAHNIKYMHRMNLSK